MVTPTRSDHPTRRSDAGAVDPGAVAVGAGPVLYALVAVGAMDGWVTLIFDRGTIGDLVGELIALALFALFALDVLGAGTLRLRHQPTH